MRRTTIKIAAALLAIAMLAGCAPKTTAPDASSAPQITVTPESTAAPTIRDTLIVGTTTKIEKAGRDDYFFDVLSGTLSQMALVKQLENGEFAPMAADYQTTDAKTWTFTIVEGLKWQDGTPVTANDFKFTLEYLDKQEEGKYLGKYEAVNVKDDRTLELVLKTPNIRALADLTTLRLIPQHIYKDIEKLADATEEQATLGCGAYKFVSFDRSAGVLEFVANRDFGSGKQRVERVLFKMYGNADTMYMALKTGELDMVYNYAGGVDPVAAEDLAKSENITLTTVKDIGNTAVLVFNNSKAPWSDLTLRMAVYHALDYDKFRELFGSPYSIPATAGFLPAGSLGYIDTAVNKRNLEESKRLLAQAGAADSNGDGILELSGKPLSIELLIRSDKPVYQRYGELIQANLKEVGIDVSLKLVEVPQFRSITEKEHTNDAMITKFTAFGMGMGGGVGTAYMDGRLTANAQGQVNSQDFYEVADALKSADTMEKYKKAAEDCQRYYAANVPAIALYWDSYIQAYNSKLSGFTVDGTFGILNMDTWFSMQFE
ncbi:MAG: ABC transporter substrate-binding protein [Angelakisella sp.]